MGAPGEDTLTDLERYRPYLRLLAGADVDERLRGKLDLSGVVQQTLWEAHLSRDRFTGIGDRARLAWLRRILVRNLLDEVRRLGRKSADATIERSIEDSSARLAAELAADDTSPSDFAVRSERAIRLVAALELLPVDQRQAILRHHLQGVPLAEVATEMDRSKEAIAGLIHRGLMRLRIILRDDST